MTEALLKLNLGCGTKVAEGWVNIDGSLTARLSRFPRVYRAMCRIFGVPEIPWHKSVKVLDLRSGLPFPDASVGVIYSSHMLEHFSPGDAVNLLKECHRCLAKGGLIRIVVPDLYAIARKYVALQEKAPSIGNPEAFLQALNMSPFPVRGIKRFFYERFAFSRHAHMYDEVSLRALLLKCGFADVRREEYARGRIQDLREVEDAARYCDAVCLEAVR